MSSNGIVIHSNQISRAGLNQQVLKNGSSVLVRIIEDKGNGKYTGSVAGVRVNLSSTKAYSVGSSFVAKINVADGKIFVTPENSTENPTQKLEVSILKNEQIVAFLKNLGMPTDSVSINLFQQLKQMEMKFDDGLLRKLHSLALKFKGKEKSASELLMMLSEKKITADLEEIKNLIALLYKEEIENDSEEKGENNQLLNRFNSTKGSWFLFPFKMMELESNNVIGNGVIRILVSKNEQLKMLNIDCNYKERKFLFNLIYEAGKCKKIRFNISNFKVENINQKVLDLSKRLLAVNETVAVEWADAEEIEGTACQSEDFFTFEGAV